MWNTSADFVWDLYLTCSLVLKTQSQNSTIRGFTFSHFLISTWRIYGIPTRTAVWRTSTTNCWQSSTARGRLLSTFLFQIADLLLTMVAAPTELLQYFSRRLDTTGASCKASMRHVANNNWLCSPPIFPPAVTVSQQCFRNKAKQNSNLRKT